MVVGKPSSDTTAEDIMSRRYFKPGDVVRVVLDQRVRDGRRGTTFYSREPVIVPDLYDRADLSEHEIVRAVGQILEITDGMYSVSLTEVDLAARLFEGMVPELAAQQVRVMDIKRIPGVGSKMMVAACVAGIDPVGTFVGHRGGRVAVVQRILGEDVQILAYASNPEERVRAALRGNQDARIEVDEERGIAEIWLPAHQHGPVLGKNGVNAQMLSDLLGYRLVLREA